MTKKKLPVRFTGQHFNIDTVLIKDTIKQAGINSNDTVIDIGAGKGFLTDPLLQKAKTVIAIEKDFGLVNHLSKKFTNTQNIQIVGCDFRDYKVLNFPFKVVSNIPYNITSSIFKILMFENVENFMGGSIVLQSEPAQKIFSRKIYNPLTVFYHTFYDLNFLYEISPESFLPPPTVKSALLKIERKKPSFDLEFKVKYLNFILYMLRKPDLTVRTAMKTLFRKKQVRSLSEKFKINLNSQTVSLSARQWKGCFLEMLRVIPEKFHPS